MRRVTELDAIRGLAALGVMIYHLDPPAFLFKGVRVDLFLILSGYLVTSIILHKGQVSNFYLVFQMRRILRLWPLYYLTLAALVAVNTFLVESTAIDALPNYLTFTQNIQRYWSDSSPPFKWYYTHTWSLALEQQFYLFWPLVFMLLGRRRLIGVSLVLLATSVIARTLGFHWWLLIARCDGFALGSILAVLFSDRGRSEARKRLLSRAFAAGLGASLALLVATLPFSLQFDFDVGMGFWPSATVLGFNLVYFCLIGQVLCYAGHPDLWLLRDRRLIFLGTVSYGVYIFHPLTFLSVSRACGALGLEECWWTALVKLASSVALAALSYDYLERPILSLRDYFSFGPVRLSRGTPGKGTLQGAGA
jgi:peptidoglycan/LPS O-acetylase OafA/YrhL